MQMSAPACYGVWVCAMSRGPDRHAGDFGTAREACRFNGMVSEGMAGGQVKRGLYGFSIRMVIAYRLEFWSFTQSRRVRNRCSVHLATATIVATTGV